MGCLKCIRTISIIGNVRNRDRLFGASGICAIDSSPRKNYGKSVSGKNLIFFDFRLIHQLLDPKPREGKHFHASGMRAIDSPDKNGVNDALRLKSEKIFLDPDPCHLRRFLRIKSCKNKISDSKSINLF